MLLAIDIKLAFMLFAGLTLVVHTACALAVLFHFMKNPPKSGPSIGKRFLLTLLLGAIGFVYFIFMLKEPENKNELES
ncbi:hypothetical protein PQO03_13260 [Lentisphaera profundi]|uniref:Cardiolipin synthase N-terminal domain-containing protein n=1 Tax=Lentisphaera profundi TaxID=1658616 RepID=A0ABY7W106_9BACT|nr:hypothetical protein [Lentisphaera profundi]WDE98802.1 hypothetical protein PQO03_13260 [Lentisphaera profundi]